MRIQSPGDRSSNSEKCDYFIHVRQIMRIHRTVRPMLDLSEVLWFHTDSRNYENPKPWATEARIPRNILGNIHENQQDCAIEARAVRSEVLFFHTASRSYENPKPWATPARTSRNASMSYIFSRLWELTELLWFHTDSQLRESKSLGDPG